MKQQKFLEAYMENDFDGVKAVEQAYSDITSDKAKRTMSYKLRNHPIIKTEIEKAEQSSKQSMEEALVKHNLEADRLMGEIDRILKDPTTEKKDKLKSIRTALEVRGDLGGGTKVGVFVASQCPYDSPWLCPKFKSVAEEIEEDIMRAQER